MSNEVVDLLFAAKHQIERQGWRQGPRYANDKETKAEGAPRQRLPGCCASDALIDAQELRNFGTNVALDAGACLQQALYTIIPTAGSVIGWNDQPERTAADVFALYDKAIDLARRAP